jgi:hypothetical protein
MTSLSGVRTTCLFAVAIAVFLIVIPIESQAAKARDSNASSSITDKAAPPAAAAVNPTDAPLLAPPRTISDIKAILDGAKPNARGQALREAMMALVCGIGYAGAGGNTEFAYAYPLFWAP